MKKLILAILCLLPFAVQTQAQEPAKYLKGAVPEVNGVVTFSETFNIPNSDKEKNLQTVTAFIKESLLAPAIQDIRTRIIADGAEDGTVVARVEEYIVFKHKPLMLDRTRIRYQLTAKVTDSGVKMDINQISYYYNEDMEGKNGEPYKAEEWITDKASVNKKGTKLFPRSGKFRRKTIDRMEAIFSEAKAALGAE